MVIHMAWYDEAVFYHIYPLGMLGAPEKNEYKEVVHRLRELDNWIDHLKKIGVNAIYIGPLLNRLGMDMRQRITESLIQDLEIMLTLLHL